MAIDENLGKLVLQAFQEKLGGRKLICGICGGTRWGVDGIANISLQGHLSGGIVIGGNHLPLVPFTCEVCGNTQLLNAIRLLGRETFERLTNERRTDGVLGEAERILKEKGGKEL